MAPKKPLTWVGGRPRRVGFVGRFVGLFGFPLTLFDVAPDSIDVAVFDLVHGGRRAEYLGSVVDEYHTLDLDQGLPDELQAHRMAELINGADLDVLMNVNWKRDAYDMLDCVTAPCIVNYCVGSDLLHHPKVDFHWYNQPQADYPLRDGYVWSNATRRPFSLCPAYSGGGGHFDSRGLQQEASLSWRDRDPLIVLHGSLDKLEQPEFIDCLVDLLSDHPTVDCVLMGKDNGRALASVARRARARGVHSRVHYEGAYSAMRGPDGRIDDPGWQRMVSFLRRARLAPDPWPVGGGSSRVECYLMGVPTVHMGVRFEPSTWGQSQHSLCEIPSLLISAGTAFSITDYQDMCAKCLTDEDFAAHLVAEQAVVAARATDGLEWWKRFIEICESWQANRLTTRLC
ncbi:MAG: hypothetical protein AB1806_18580 [Acidobacteriota bacterium]